MKSIHRYLLVSLITALSLGTLLIAVFLYVKSAEEINELYDSNMENLAHAIHAQYRVLELAMPPDANSKSRDHQDEILEEEEFLVQIWRQDGDLAYTTHALIQLPQQAASGFSITRHQQQKWRVFVLRAAYGTVQVAQPQAARHLYIWQLALGLLYPLLLQIPLIGILIWIAVGRSLQPLQRMSKAIQERSASSLEHLNVQGLPQEIRPLTDALNSLLTRLGDAIEVQRNFTADAAHELRTPLAALQLQADVLARSKSEQERSEAIQALQKGIARASHLVVQLLTLARLDPALDKQHQALELEQVVRLAMEDCLDQAAARHIDLGLHVNEPMHISGNADDIRILARNLVDNAIRYSAEHGKVDVLLRQDQGQVVLEVRDSAPVIAASERQRLFERFYRGAASDSLPGSGLGLAIVNDIVQQHHGRIEIGQRPDGPGNAFVISFPQLKLQSNHV